MSTIVRFDRPTNLDSAAGRPAGFELDGEHWSVSRAAPGDVEYMPVDRWVVLSWNVRAQTDARDDSGDFILRRDGRGWVVESASFG